MWRELNILPPFLPLCFLLCLILCSITAARTLFAASPKTHRYAIIVGNNTPGADSTGQLATLRYADDDSIRIYQFLNRFVTTTHLLTMPDSATQQRYPRITSIAKMPSTENLNQAVSDIARRIADDKSKGDESIVYLYFSGHGSHNKSGVPGLVLTDTQLTRDNLYQNVIDVLSADYIHLFVDACYAEGIVGSRGLFGKEENATQAPLNTEEQHVLNFPNPSTYPGLGIFISSSASQETHEWSRLESGVFTHVVLSGLSGLADINGDGHIAYSELYAFTAAANRNVVKSQAHIDVVFNPPQRNQNEPIVDIEKFSGGAYLKGDLSTLERFYISGETVRILDGHIEGSSKGRFLVPAEQPLYIVSKNREAVITLARNEERDIRNLTFAPLETQSKGVVAHAYAKGLFASPYGPSYYRGIVDSRHLVPVVFKSSSSLLQLSPHNTAVNEDVDIPNDQYRLKLKRWSRVLFGSAAVGFAAAGAFAAVSLRAFATYDENRAKGNDTYYFDHSNKYVYFGTSAWISGTVGFVALIPGILMRYKSKKIDKTAFSFITNCSPIAGMTCKIHF